MPQHDMTAEDTYEAERWLTALFASAPEPIVDAAFVARILGRLQRRMRMRLMILFTAIFAAAAVTLWQVSGLGFALPSPNADFLQLPNWLATPKTFITASGAMVAALFMWMVAEDA